MARYVGVVTLAVLIAGLVGCTLKMGNTEAKLFDGWNQPSAQTQKTETINPVVSVPTAVR